VWLAFLLKFSNLQKTSDRTFFGKLFREKIKRRLPLGNFFWQHPKIFSVYVACPGDDAENFSLSLDQNFLFGNLFCTKN
jgi:hypothetical protein